MESKSSKILLAAVLAALVMASCTSSPGFSREDIPDFYLSPPMSKDFIYGVGEARMSTLSLSRTAALSRARDDIARQVQVLVKSAVSDYAQQAGEGSNQQALQFVETVSRQIASVTLSGTRTERMEPSRDGTVYALVSYPLSNMRDAARTEFTRNEGAAFAEFKADEALDRLDQEIRRNPPRPAPGGN
jgi:hypothetical protein